MTWLWIFFGTLWSTYVTRRLTCDRAPRLIAIELFQHNAHDPMSEPSITNVSSDELDDMKSQTDWKALQAKTDADIQQDIASDPDTHILDADWFRVAQGVNISHHPDDEFEL